MICSAPDQREAPRSRRSETPGGRPGQAGEVHSLADLDRCAARHLSDYCDPNGTRAFQSYDRCGNPVVFEPIDALAPALLDAAVPGSIVIQMFSPAGGPFVQLRQAIQHLLDETAVDEPIFEELDLGEPASAWKLVLDVLRSSDETHGLAASKVTKMVHRKRPHLVPIFDSKVAAFYETTAGTPWILWPRLQQDIRATTERIDALRRGRSTPDGRRLSRLRTADIVIWEHQVTRCNAGST